MPIVRVALDVPLSTLFDYTVAEGIAVETDIGDGLPADEILHYAEDKGVDLIIMSTHGKSGVSRWFSGSVAEKVVSQSFIPVLVVTPPGCRISK